jgi:hypothetical protein
MHTIETCDFCKTRLAIKQVIANGTREELVAKLREVESRMWEAEASVDYHEAIMDGSWPTSVRILSNALEKAKALKRVTTV